MGADDFFSSKTGDKQVTALLNHDWAGEAKKSPESLAGQLSRMLTTELFQMHQMSSKTAVLIQNHARDIKFQEGSCTVNNVALLSARTVLFVEKDGDENEADQPGTLYEAVDYDIDDEEMEAQRAGVAVQIEVLYDVSQEFEAGSLKSEADEIENEDKPAESNTEVIQSTIVSVATIQGWLKGGPEGELRWRLALHRPAFEFPGIQQAY
jgi:hypothetical protein